MPTTSFKDLPDPNIDWEHFKNNTRSEEIRPYNGYKRCYKCKKLKAINIWNFSKDTRSGDGYSNLCKECRKMYNNSTYRRKKASPRDLTDEGNPSNNK